MTGGDTDAGCAAGPTPAEARCLLPELTAVMLTGGLLISAMARAMPLPSGDHERAGALWRRWRAVAAAECDDGRCGHDCMAGPCDGVWRGGRDYAGLVTLIAVRECRDVLSDADAA